MTQTNAKKFADYIVPLEVNGLNGRMLKMPARDSRKREILLINGHHSSIERMQGLAELLHDYGGVTVTDLPGFGGMESFYKIGQKPTLDNLADYLASFIKLRYRNRRFTIVGVSFGFLVATRMLQRNPEMAKKVDLLVSVVGFTHYDEFTFSKSRYHVYLYSSRLLARKTPAWFFRNLALHPLAIRLVYTRTHNAKHKFKNLSPADRKRMINFEIHLWRCNDVRTSMYTSAIMLTVDNCRVKVDLPVYHLAVKKDNYFDNHIVEQHMRVVFSDFTLIPINMNSHSTTIIATKQESAPLVPPKLRSLLSQQ